MYRLHTEEMQSASPPGSCEAGLEVAVDGVSQFSPDIKVTVNTNGDSWALTGHAASGLRSVASLFQYLKTCCCSNNTATQETWFDISGSVQASYDTLVTGQGSCSYTLKRGLPKKPKTKVICAGKFCISPVH